MQKFRNQYDNETKDDNTGDFYDSPVLCGGLTRDPPQGTGGFRPVHRNMICNHCKINFKSAYKGKKPYCNKCKRIILIERECSTCNIKYKTKFTGDNPNCYLCISKDRSNNGKNKKKKKKKKNENKGKNNKKNKGNNKKVKNNKKI